MSQQIRGTVQVRVSEPFTPTGTLSSPPLSGMAPVLDFISSDETLDRYGEVIAPEGWDLRHYRKNPVFQNAHNYGDVIHTIGRAIITEVRDGRLFQRIEFATEANPVAKIAHALYKGGFLNAVSVGFLPVEWEEGTAKTPWRRRYLRQELLEVSAVGVPANPNALMLSLKTGAMRRDTLLEIEDMVRSLPPTEVRFSLARALRELLRKV
jgi:HK97 family phage prohead protease